MNFDQPPPIPDTRRNTFSSPGYVSGALTEVPHPADSLPAFPTMDGEYLLWVKITGGVLDTGVDPNPAWTGPPPDSGTFVLGAIDGVIQWIDTTTCDAPPP